MSSAFLSGDRLLYVALLFVDVLPSTEVFGEVTAAEKERRRKERQNIENALADEVRREVKGDTCATSLSSNCAYGAGHSGLAHGIPKVLHRATRGRTLISS